MIMLAAGNDGQFARLCQALEREDLARDPRFATNEARVGNREELTELLDALFVQRSMSDWSERLARAGVPCGPVNDISQAFDDPQVIHRGLRVQLEHPLAGLMDTVANPVRLSASAASYTLPPPLLGEHTDEVLQRLLGMTVNEIEALRRARVV
jgi:crotonobetainyl-CoA:carnitine CoA-transferase CaiB-like acyl-CoA transferase